MGRRSSARKSAESACPRVLLGRYHLEDGPPLGEGGWCIVHRGVDAQDGHRPVAVKAFRAQAARELGDDGVLERFVREVRTFQALGVGPPAAAGSSGDAAATVGALARGGGTGRCRTGASARDLLVNLLDFSRAPGSDEPGPAEDGRCYTILELADESLDAFLRRRAGAADFVGRGELQEVARAVAGGLAWLHAHGLFHLDIKPENVMRFGGVWKLIDLDGCLQGGVAKVSRGGYTPMYAAPELARFSLDDRPDAPPLEPTAAMDIWAAGIVLLDVLAHCAALQETKTSFDTAGLFEEEAIMFESWYRWLADAAPLDLDALVPAPAPSAALIRGEAALRDLLGRLVDKEAARRPTAEEVLQHPFLAEDASGECRRSASAEQQAPAANAARALVEASFCHAKDAGALGQDGSAPVAAFLALFARVGLGGDDAQLLMEALNPRGRERLTYTELLDFLYR